MASKLLSLFVAAAVILSCVPAVTAVVIPSVTNVAPDQDNRRRDTAVEISIRNNGTSSQRYNVTFKIRKPNGTVLFGNGLKRITGNIAGETSKSLGFTISDDRFDSFGRYDFIVNESVTERDTSFEYEAIPQPLVDMNFENLELKLNDETQFQQITLDIQELDVAEGTPLFSEITPGVVSVYNVSWNGSTQFYTSYPLKEANQTEVLVATFNESDYQPGIYGALANFTVQGGRTVNYTQKKQENFRVTTDRSTMELSLAAIPAFLAVLFFLFSRSFASNRDGEADQASMMGVALSQLFMGLSLLMATATAFVGVELTRLSSIYGNMTGFYTTLMYAGGFIVFLFMFLVFVLWYVIQAGKAGANGKPFQGLQKDK